MEVFLVTLFTTGQSWNSMICLNEDTVQAILAEYKITELLFESNTRKEFREYFNPNDTSQTATVVLKQIHEIE